LSKRNEKQQYSNNQCSYCRKQYGCR
jgi:hypothetical protein